MGKNFHDVMTRRSELLHQLAIWQEVVEHLTKFLDTDATPATIGIRAETEGGMVVPQDRIETVVNEIRNGYMAEVNEELTAINKSEVADGRKEQHKSKKTVQTKKESKKSKGPKAVKTTAARPKSNKRKVGARK